MQNPNLSAVHEAYGIDSTDQIGRFARVPFPCEQNATGGHRRRLAKDTAFPPPLQENRMKRLALVAAIVALAACAAKEEAATDTAAPAAAAPAMDSMADSLSDTLRDSTDSM